MSILNPKTNKITPTNLRNRAFELIHWGSPLHWKDHNSKAYEWVGSFDNEWESWQIIYFPKKFEGTATPGMIYAMDMCGRFMMTRNDSNSDHFVSPVCNTMEDLDIFIQAVLDEKYPEAHKMVKSGDLKYM